MDRSQFERHVGPSADMIDEIHDHLVFVLREKLNWTDAQNPALAAGGGHVVIRFERAGRRYVFRVAKHGLAQHKRTMLAYRLVGSIGLMPEKIYHDGVCVVERYAEGRPLSARASDEILARLGRALGQLHAVQAVGFGPLDHDNAGHFCDAMGYFSAQPSVELDWADSDVPQGLAETLERAVEEVHQIPRSVREAPVRLGHGDLWRDNVLFCDTGFTIIDWDRIGAYPVERDLAILLDAGLTGAQVEIALSAYPQRGSVSRERLNWFAKRRVLRDRGLRLFDKALRLDSIDLTTSRLGGVQP